MPTGKVRFYDEEKGFGFITSDEGQDVFLHATALPAGTPPPKAGTKLEFGIAEGKRGPQALSVRVVEAPVSLAKRSRKPADAMSNISRASSWTVPPPGTAASSAWAGTA